MTTTETTGENDLEALTGAVVKRMARLFKPYPTWDRDALMSEGIDLARGAARTYQPGKSALSTWVSVVVWRGLKTIHRTAEREAKRERAHGVAVIYHHQGRAFEDVDESLPVDQRVVQVYLRAVHTVGRRPRGRGPRIYQPAQDVSLVALARMLKMSYREVIFYLNENPKVLSALGLKSLPSHQKIFRLCNRFRGITANNRASGRIRRHRMASAYITEHQAAELVGLSRVTLARWRCKRQAKFTVYRPGGRVRYLKVEVVKWMEAQAVAPTSA